MKIIFDATVLTSIYKRDAGRSGIFFASFNIFSQFINRKDIEIFLYANPYSYVEFKKFQNDYCPNEKTLYRGDVSWLYIALYNWFLKKHAALFSHSFLRKPLALGILIVRFLIKTTASRLINYEIANFCDIFFSPVYAIPQKIQKKKILKSIMLYDTIPLKFPEYYPSGSFLDDIRKTGKSDNLYIFDSHCAHEDFKNFFPFVNDENSIVAHLAASEKFTPCVDLLNSNIKAKYRIPEKKKYIFSLCTLEPRKNLVRAVKTFIQFVEKNNIKDLVWVLGGAHWDSFTKQFNEDIGNSDIFKEFVISAGYIDDDDLPVLYSNAEWFVYTSQYEGFGLPPLEAMQCGCPVITSNNSSLPEVVGDAGIMIDWDSDEQHIEAYEKYYFNETLRKENSRKGLERAKQFSWKKTVDEMINVINEKTA